MPGRSIGCAQICGDTFNLIYSSRPEKPTVCMLVNTQPGDKQGTLESAPVELESLLSLWVGLSMNP